MAYALSRQALRSWAGCWSRIGWGAPRTSDTMDGKREYRAPKGYAPTQDDYGFSLQFVITASLRLTEAHSHLAPPAWLADEDKAPWRREWERIPTGTWPHEGYL